MALKQTAFRLDADDFAILEAVMRQTGMRSKVDALRYVLRQYAQQHEIAWGDAKKPTRTTAKPRKRK